LTDGRETDETGQNLEKDDKDRDTERGIDGEVEEVERARVGSVVVIVGTRSNG
jgi:hypothetical protein